MQTSRTRQVTARKGRLWVSSFIQLTLSVAGQAGQSEDLSPNDDFFNKVDRNFRPTDTLAHTYMKGVWTQSAAGDSSREILAFGVGFYPLGIDVGDYPNVRLHDGDWQMHDVRGFREPTTLQTPLVFQQLATVDVESSGQRSVPRGGAAYKLVVVGESSIAPSAGSFEFTGVLTCLWLI